MKSFDVKTINKLLGLDGLRFVVNCYTTLLKREPEYMGMQNYILKLSINLSKEEMILSLYNSTERKLCNPMMKLPTIFILKCLIVRNLSIFFNKRRYFNYIKPASITRDNVIAVYNLYFHRNPDTEGEIVYQQYRYNNKREMITSLNTAEFFKNNCQYL
jgi:hypothetical protein